MVIEDWQFWLIIVLIIVLIVAVWNGLSNIDNRLARIRRDEVQQYETDTATRMLQAEKIEQEIGRVRSSVGTLGIQLETLGVKIDVVKKGN